MEASKRNMTVFSDYICPFCFIGARLAERLAGELPIRPVWRGFEIHPETPPEGVPLSRFMPSVISGLTARVQELADEIGLEMSIPIKLSNSRLALLGGEFAREEDRLNEYHEAVFSAYFQQGKDIGDIEALLEIADSIGLDRDSFRQSLLNGEHIDALKDSVRRAHSLGLSAVPSFVFDNGSTIIGAQPYDLLKAAAEKYLLDAT